MLWFWLSLVSAVFVSLQHLCIKKAVKDADVYLASWGHRVFSLLFLLPALLIVGMPPLGEQVWTALLIAAVVAVFAVLLYAKALKLSDMSLVVPLIGITPLVLLVTTPLVLGEKANSFGTAGVILVVVGAYLVNASKLRDGPLEPLRALFYDRGSRLMLIAAVLYAFWTMSSKVGVRNSSPLFFVTATNLSLALVLTPFVLRKSTTVLKQLRTNWLFLAAAGFSNAVLLASEFTAYQYTQLSYVIAVKRVSLLISVLLGWLILKEEDFKGRFFGTLVIFAGLLVLYLKAS